MKNCSICGELKPVEAFHRDARSPDGHRSDCKSCVNARMRWRRQNPGMPTPAQQQLSALSDAGLKRCAKCGRTLPIGSFHQDSSRAGGRFAYCGDCTKAHVASYMADPEYRRRARETARRAYSANRSVLRAKGRAAYVAHRAAHLESSRVRHEKNRELDNARVRDWYQKNKEHVLQYQRDYADRNRELLRANGRLYHAWRRRNDPRYVVDHRMARAMAHSLGRAKAGRSWEALVGYTLDELMLRLEDQFVEGMSWENRGSWHIDHIIPRSAFGYIGADDASFRVCWSLWNLRPLWGIENICKSGTLPSIAQVPVPLREIIVELGLAGFDWLTEAG